MTTSLVKLNICNDIYKLKFKLGVKEFFHSSATLFQAKSECDCKINAPFEMKSYKNKMSSVPF